MAETTHATQFLLSCIVKELSEVCFKVLEDDKQWWKLRNRSGQAGYVPYNMLDVVKLEDPQVVSDPPYSPVTPYSPVNKPNGLNLI